MFDSSPPAPAPVPEVPRSVRQTVPRLLFRLAGSHALVGAVFLVFLAQIYPSGREERLTMVAATAIALAGFGSALLLFTWFFLAPLHAVVSETNLPLERLAHAGTRARRLPALGGTLTLLFWGLGAVAAWFFLADSGLPRAAILASLFSAVCTGVISLLLYYYLAVSELFAARVLLPSDAQPGRGASIGMRFLITSVAILAVGVGSVGAAAYLNHQLALEQAAVSSCDRALRALAVLEAPTGSIVDAAAKACDGNATIAAAGRVLASIGAEGIVGLREGRNPRGVLLTMPLRSGTTLYVLVSDRSWSETGKRFAGEMLAFALMALVLATFVALVASRAITAPVRGLAEAAQAIARGDLSRDVQVLTGDEIGSLASSFGAMTSGLRQLVGNLSGAASSLSAQVATVVKAGGLVQSGSETRRDGVTNATREMTRMDKNVAEVGRDVSGLNEYVVSTGAALAEFAASLEEVRRHGRELQRAVQASRTEVQALLHASDSVRTEIAALASTAQTTLSAIGESGRTLNALGDAAREGERVGQRLFEETRTGAQVVEQGVRGVEAIRGVVAEARARVQALGARSADITAVVDFIAEVAGRTNLLSLNAAIIAAQAGEQGKPFGVVADQIRELASQIGSSTKRIADIIAGVRLEVEATSALIQQSDELAASGVERAREGGEALKRLAEESKHAREVSLSILPVVTAYTGTARQFEQLAARVVEQAQGFAGVELLARGGRSIEGLAQSLEPLTTRIGRALEEQTSVSHKQVESVEEIRRMIARLDETVAEHGEGTAKVLKELGQLVHLADEDQRAVTELAFAAQALTRHAQALREGLQQFRM